MFYFLDRRFVNFNEVHSTREKNKRDCQLSCRFTEASFYGSQVLEILLHYGHPGDIAVIHLKFNLAKIYLKDGQKDSCGKFLCAFAVFLCKVVMWYLASCVCICPPICLSDRFKSKITGTIVTGFGVRPLIHQGKRMLRRKSGKGFFWLGR